jgi:hypothetical protein
MSLPACLPVATVVRNRCNQHVGHRVKLYRVLHSRLFFPAESRELSSDHDQEITWAVNLQDGHENQNPDYKD